MCYAVVKGLISGYLNYLVITMFNLITSIVHTSNLSMRTMYFKQNSVIQAEQKRTPSIKITVLLVTGAVQTIT